jgi:PAS domain-containing protein/flagellar motor switch/type III secretory pathway protein FliN
MPQSLRILLLADNPDVIRRIGHGLQRQDSGLILLEGADSLATARRRLGAGAYDVALVDLALGHGDGLHLLSDLHDIAPDLPMVALDAAGGGPDVAACMALGAQDRLAPEAMDSAGLLDRLTSATARAKAGESSRRRSQRVAASLGATRDLAWHYDAGHAEVWLAAAEPAFWQLPAPECSESLDAVRARVHPDDRELLLRQLEELATTAEPWTLDARIRIEGGAYRWCTLRGRAELDSRGELKHASGVLSDAQRQQRKLRELEQGRRFLRAVFDSVQVPQAVVDSAAVITDCNDAWAELTDPACHAGGDFVPGCKFLGNPGAFGDLDADDLARGVRQVIGGVADHFGCEYGDSERRWRIDVYPLRNPGIAGAVISHQEITATRRATAGLQGALEAAEGDLRAIRGPIFRVARDFEVLAANEDATVLGRAPIIGRDVLKVLPRVDADTVGEALAAVAAGAPQSVQDARAADGRVTRWTVAPRRDAAGDLLGFLVHGIEVSDLAQPTQPVAVKDDADAGHARIAEELRVALSATEAEREQIRASLQRALQDAEAVRGQAEASLSRFEQAQQEAARAHQEAEEACGAAERARAEAEELRRQAEAAGEEGARLAELLDAERAKHGETLAALSAAEQIPTRLRAELARARQGLRSGLDELLEGAFASVLDRPDPQAAPPGRTDSDREKAG